MKVIHIMVGGPQREIPDLEAYNQPTIIWLGVDGGAKWLLENDIVPDHALGDFDSLTAAELEMVRAKVATVEQFPAEKDQTDTELGLTWAIDQGADVIRIFGTSGGRIDHLLANLMMLTKPQFREAIEKVELIDRYNFLKMYAPGTHTITKIQDMQYVAFTTMGNVDGLTLKGFKYPLTDAAFPFGVALSSNEFLGTEGEFSFQSGLILMSQSRDEGV